MEIVDKNGIMQAKYMKFESLDVSNFIFQIEIACRLSFVRKRKVRNYFNQVWKLSVSNMNR